MREHTMRRIESMGLKAPKAWKDELYRNELTKLDIQQELLYSKSNISLQSGTVDASKF